MTDPNRPLDVARADLAQRTLDAETMEQWQERSVLSNLADVADMVCRIGDHPHSAHYRADKAGRLVGAALDVQWECLNAYAAETADDEIVAELERANDILQEVAAGVRAVMWAITRSDRDVGLYVSDISGLRRVASAFARWAGRVADQAVPDPVDDVALPEVEPEDLPTRASPPGAFSQAERHTGIDHPRDEGGALPFGAVLPAGRVPGQGNEAGPW